MTGVLHKLVDLMHGLIAALGKLSGWLLLALVVVQFVVVLARTLLAVNFLWLQELTLYLHASTFMLAAAWSLCANKHVRIDILRERSSDATNRKIDVLGTVFLLIPMMLAIGWTSLPYVAQSWSILEGSTEVSGLPGIFLLKTLLPIFACLMLMAGLVRLVRRSGRSM